MNYQINLGILTAIFGDSIPLLLGILFIFTVVAAAYLLGSINSAIIISKVISHDDIRRHGSGNGGTTNMLRTFGAKAALLTLLFDMLKTVLAVGIAGFLFGFQYVVGAVSVSELCYIAGICAVIGHVFPIYHKGKGGKGVLCAATMGLMLSPLLFLALLLIFVLIVATTKYVSLGSVVSVGLYPVVLHAFIKVLYPTAALSGLITVTTIALALLIGWCHRGNLKRVMEHTERKISFKKKAAPAPSEDEAAVQLPDSQTANEGTETK